MAKNQYEDLTENQRKFAEFYLELGHGTKSAIQAGYKETSAYSTASTLLKNPKVVDYLEYLREQRKSAIISRLAGYAESAAVEMYKLATTADSESVRMQASKDLLDRTGFKPTEKVENKNEISGKIEFGFIDPSSEE